MIDRPELCDHANENPVVCRCAPDCYCKTRTCLARPDRSERLVPRDLPQDDEVDLCARRLRHVHAGATRPWSDINEAEREWYRAAAKAVLEAAGVERLRAELESCRSVNAALNSKLEGEKLVNELLREKLTACESSRNEVILARELAEHETTVAEQARDEQKARADRAESELKLIEPWLQTLWSDLGENASRGERLMILEDAVRRIDVADQEKSRADRAEKAVRSVGWNGFDPIDEFMLDSWKRYEEWMASARSRGDRIAALEKVVEALREELAKQYQKAKLYGAKAQKLREECIARGAPERFTVIFDEPPCSDAAAIAYAASIGALDSAQPAPDARDERHAPSSLGPAEEREEQIDEMLDRANRELDARDERIRLLEAERDDWKELAESNESSILTAIDKIVGIEGTTWKDLPGIVQRTRDACNEKDERIRVACAELRDKARVCRDRNSQFSWATELERIANALEGNDSTLKSTLDQLESEHAAKSPDEQRKAEALGDDVAPIPGEMAHRAWVLEQHERLETRADVRMLCLIAAQFETTQPQMQPLSEKLNGPERNAGPEYAIRLVGRMRERIGR